MVTSVKESQKQNVVFLNKDLESLKNFRFKTSTISACSTKKRIGNIFLSIVTVGLAPLFSEHVRFAVRGKNIKNTYENLDLNTASDAARLHEFAVNNLKNKKVVEADAHLLSRELLKLYEQKEVGIDISDASIAEKFASLEQLSGNIELDSVLLYNEVMHLKVAFADKNYRQPSISKFEKGSTEEKHFVKNCYGAELKLYLLSVSSDQDHARALVKIAIKEGVASGGALPFYSSIAAREKQDWDRWLQRHFPGA